MLFFIGRRLVISFFILLAATAIMFFLTALSGDPLADLAELRGPDKESRIAARTEALHLDTPVPVRYLLWLQEIGRCIVPGGDACTLGLDRSGNPVLPQLLTAMDATFRLVVAATIIALVIGVIIGIVTALRQYSIFDYSTTFVAFLCFSLPVFWVSTLLKQYVAIELNTWLANPQLEYLTIALIGVLAGIVWMIVIGGNRRRKATVFLTAAAATALTLYLLLVTGWFRSPGLGPVGLLICAAAVAIGWVALAAGFRRRQILVSALAAAAVGYAAYLATQPLMADPGWLTLAGLAAATVVVSLLIGRMFGGPYRRQAQRVTVVVGLLFALLVAADRLMAAYPAVSAATGGRPIPTTGAESPNFSGTFWEVNLDYILHLILPTLAIMLISFATYTRFTRASQLDVMNQDYIRTARAKGLSERTVLVKHAFRNAMIPITTLMAFDFAGVLGGAVITETVFGWNGMGKLFVDGLTNVDPHPVMAFFLVTGAAAVIFNMLADITYAFLDPRISLK